MPPRVSVIVPAHDAAEHVERALESVRAQTFDGWEAIVVDDASSDDTLARVQALGDARIRALRSEANLGPAGARNLAVAQARGELVALLDADDAWLPEYLERQVARYDASPGAGIVACDARLVREGRELEGTYLGRVRGGAEEPTLDRLLRANTIYVSALVPRSAGEEAGWFAEDLFGTEDHDLWLRIVEAGHRAVVNREPLALYTVSDGSVASDLGRMARNHQETLRRALERGRLTPAQRRVARRELRYHRAMETVAARRPGRLLREAPLLASVVATNPGRWGDWWRALRAGGRTF